MGLVSNIKFAIQRLRGSSRGCSHTDQIRDVERSSEGCEQCIALGCYVDQTLVEDAR